MVVMRIRLSDPWRWNGTIDRGPYALLGVVLVIVKYEIDRIVSLALTGKSMPPWSYWVPGDVFGSVARDVDSAERALVMLLIALPFLWSGVVLTLRRLRSVEQPQLLVLLFFVPALNVLFFLLLCVLPARAGELEPGRGPLRSSFLDRLIPRSTAGSAAMSLAIVLPITTGLVFLSAATLGSYGWGLFVGLPFFLGLASALLHGYHEPRSLGACVGVASLATLMLAGILLAFAIEGVICILMAAPIAIALSLFGASIGCLIQSRPRSRRDASQSLLSLSIAMPLLIVVEHLHPAEPEVFEVVTSIDVGAPAEAVWKQIVSFSELPPPRELVFKSGVAYPMRAEIEGQGVGAVRHCVFSTGPFVEPIDVWDEPHRLEFSVSAQPHAMQELMIWTGAEPPHVSDYLLSRRGRFQLVELSGGRTRLEGTTWYTHKIWPAAYWRIWSDWILHKIHTRVLEHIKCQAERAGQ